MSTEREYLRIIAEHVQAQTAIARLRGLALDDAALANVGISLGSALDQVIVYRAMFYAAGTVVRLPRPSTRMTVGNLGSGGVRIRVYGTALPAPGQPADQTDPPPTDEITIGAGLALDLDGSVTRGFLTVDAGTLQVIAR